MDIFPPRIDVAPMFAKTLRELRTKLGYDSARSFYNEYLTKNSGFDANYSYYMKIEGGRTLPSPAIAAVLAEVFPGESAEVLVASYCRTLFPAYTRLFRACGDDGGGGAGLTTDEKADPGPKPRFLSMAQVAVVGRSKAHYFAFLILTLARRPVSAAELAKHLDGAALAAVIRDLVDARLAKSDGERVSSIANEMKFPRADTESARRIYSDIDRWNAEFPEEIRMKRQIQKMLLRRVSPRYLGLIKAQSEVLLDLLRAADETNPDLNEEVLMLNLSVSRGRLPG